MTTFLHINALHGVYVVVPAHHTSAESLNSSSSPSPGGLFFMTSWSSLSELSSGMKNCWSMYFVTMYFFLSSLSERKICVIKCISGCKWEHYVRKTCGNLTYFEQSLAGFLYSPRFPSYILFTFVFPRDSIYWWKRKEMEYTINKFLTKLVWSRWLNIWARMLSLFLFLVLVF